MRRLGALQDFFGGRLANLGAPVEANDAVPRNFLRYDLPTSCWGQPLAGEKLPGILIPEAMTLAAGLPNSRSRCLVAPTADATFTLYRLPAGSTQAVAVATLKFSAGVVGAGAFTMASALALADGDLLYWLAPATQDSTAADIHITLRAVR